MQEKKRQMSLSARKQWIILPRPHSKAAIYVKYQYIHTKLVVGAWQDETTYASKKDYRKTKMLVSNYINCWN